MHWLGLLPDDLRSLTNYYYSFAGKGLLVDFPVFNYAQANMVTDPKQVQSYFPALPSM